jgi:hypothetical protein
VVPQLIYLSLVEVPEKAIVPFIVNAFDYVTFIHRFTWDLPGKFWKKREIKNLEKEYGKENCIDRGEIPPIIIDFDDDESSDEESWIQSNMIRDWTGTLVVNDRSYIIRNGEQGFLELRDRVGWQFYQF